MWVFSCIQSIHLETSPTSLSQNSDAPPNFGKVDVPFDQSFSEEGPGNKIDLVNVSNPIITVLSKTKFQINGQDYAFNRNYILTFESDRPGSMLTITCPKGIVFLPSIDGFLHVEMTSKCQIVLDDQSLNVIPNSIDVNFTDIQLKIDFPVKIVKWASYPTLTSQQVTFVYILSNAPLCSYSDDKNACNDISPFVFSVKSQFWQRAYEYADPVLFGENSTIDIGNVTKNDEVNLTKVKLDDEGEHFYLSLTSSDQSVALNSITLPQAVILNVKTSVISGNLTAPIDSICGKNIHSIEAQFANLVIPTATDKNTTDYSLLTSKLSVAQLFINIENSTPIEKLQLNLLTGGKFQLFNVVIGFAHLKVEKEVISASSQQALVSLFTPEQTPKSFELTCDEPLGDFSFASKISVNLPVDTLLAISGSEFSTHKNLDVSVSVNFLGEIPENSRIGVHVSDGYTLKNNDNTITCLQAKLFYYRDFDTTSASCCLYEDNVENCAIENSIINAFPASFQWGQFYSQASIKMRVAELCNADLINVIENVTNSVDVSKRFTFNTSAKLVFNTISSPTNVVSVTLSDNVIWDIAEFQVHGNLTAPISSFDNNIKNLTAEVMTFFIPFEDKEKTLENKDPDYSTIMGQFTTSQVILNITATGSPPSPGLTLDIQSQSFSVNKIVLAGSRLKGSTSDIAPILLNPIQTKESSFTLNYTSGSSLKDKITVLLPPEISLFVTGIVESKIIRVKFSGHPQEYTGIHVPLTTSLDLCPFTAVNLDTNFYLFSEFQKDQPLCLYETTATKCKVGSQFTNAYHASFLWGQFLQTDKKLKVKISEECKTDLGNVLSIPKSQKILTTKKDGVDFGNFEFAPDSSLTFSSFNPPCEIGTLDFTSGKNAAKLILNTTANIENFTASLASVITSEDIQLTVDSANFIMMESQKIVNFTQQFSNFVVQKMILNVTSDTLMFSLESEKEFEYGGYRVPFITKSQLHLAYVPLSTQQTPTLTIKANSKDSYGSKTMTFYVIPYTMINFESYHQTQFQGPSINLIHTAALPANYVEWIRTDIDVTIPFFSPVSLQPPPLIYLHNSICIYSQFHDACQTSPRISDNYNITFALLTASPISFSGSCHTNLSILVVNSELNLEEKNYSFLDDKSSITLEHYDSSDTPLTKVVLIQHSFIDIAGINIEGCLIAPLSAFNQPNIKIVAKSFELFCDSSEKANFENALTNLKYPEPSNQALQVKVLSSQLPLILDEHNVSIGGNIFFPRNISIPIDLSFDTSGNSVFELSSSSSAPLKDWIILASIKTTLQVKGMDTKSQYIGIVTVHFTDLIGSAEISVLADPQFDKSNLPFTTDQLLQVKFEYIIPIKFICFVKPGALCPDGYTSLSLVDKFLEQVKFSEKVLILAPITLSSDDININSNGVNFSINETKFEVKAIVSILFTQDHDFEQAIIPSYLYQFVSSGKTRCLIGDLVADIRSIELANLEIQNTANISVSLTNGSKNYSHLNSQIKLVDSLILGDKTFLSFSFDKGDIKVCLSPDSLTIKVDDCILPWVDLNSNIILERNDENQLENVVIDREGNSSFLPLTLVMEANSSVTLLDGFKTQQGPAIKLDVSNLQSSDKVTVTLPPDIEENSPIVPGGSDQQIEIIVTPKSTPKPPKATLPLWAIIVFLLVEFC